MHFFVCWEVFLVNSLIVDTYILSWLYSLQCNNFKCTMLRVRQEWGSVRRCKKLSCRFVEPNFTHCKRTEINSPWVFVWLSRIFVFFIYIISNAFIYVQLFALYTRYTCEYIFLVLSWACRLFNTFIRYIQDNTVYLLARHGLAKYILWQDQIQKI